MLAARMSALSPSAAPLLSLVLLCIDFQVLTAARAPRLSHMFDSFYAAQDIAVGEELSFDYGIEYWVFRDMQPLNDSRGLQIALRRAVRYIGAFAQALKAARFGLPL